MIERRAFGSIAGLLLCATACSRPAGDGAIRYALTGKVVELRAAAREVLVAHDDIRGFMPAMTMPFKFREGASVPTLASGDEISGTLAVAENGSWIENVRVLRHGAPIPRPSTPSAYGSVGDEVPDFRLLNQDRRDVRIHGYRGSALVVGFIYTRCPLPEFCPLLMRHFRALAQGFSADPQLRERARLITVTFDVEHDTPEVLRDYGLRYMPAKQPEPFARWELATGTPEQIEAITRFFGVSYSREPEGTIGHSMTTAVVGPDGRVAALHRGNSWEVAQVLESVRVSLSADGR